MVPSSHRERYQHADGSETCYQKRIAFPFLGGFPLTLVVHAYGFTNHFTIHDQVRNVFGIPAAVTPGRWLLPLVLEIGSRLRMPWLHGLMLAETFGWHKRLPTLLAALMSAIFPTLTENIHCIRMVDAYGYAMLRPRRMRRLPTA